MKIPFLKNFLAIMIAVFCLTSCNEDPSNYAVGNNWINSNTKVLFIDTLTVASSSFKFDSISVSGATRLLIGAYRDTEFGLVKSKVFTQLNSSVYSIDSDAIYDSIALILKYDGYVYNDTLQPQRFSVHRVLEEIKPDENNYYNTTAFNYKNEAIGTRTFTPRPFEHDSLLIKLDDTYGKEIFENLQQKNITNSDEFLQAYRGLLIEADDTNTSILGFSPQSLVRIYYTIPDETDDIEGILDFAFSTTNSFHNISSNFSDTWFDAIENQTTYLLSTSTNNQTFIQAGTGIATRIDFPTLQSLNNIEGTGTIMEAYLKISLKKPLAEKNLTTHDSLQFFIINQRSEVLSEAFNYDGSTALGYITEQDDEYSILTYTVPIKYYLDTKAEDYNGDNWYLVMYSQQFNSSLDRYIFYAEKNPVDYKMKLELTYALYDE